MNKTIDASIWDYTNSLIIHYVYGFVMRNLVDVAVKADASDSISVYVEVPTGDCVEVAIGGSVWDSVSQLIKEMNDDSNN
jgi:hypothetical protein